MNLKTQTLSAKLQESKMEGSQLKESVLPGEIKDLKIEYLSINGPMRIDQPTLPGYYIVLISLKGSAYLTIQGKKVRINSKSIIRIPHKQKYSIQIKSGEEFYFLCFTKQMDEDDLRLITQVPDKHSYLYFKLFSECPVYSEDIKSNKTINRMILPEGLVPRFCIGSVETSGPDSVLEHEHLMLDQLFFGLDNCRCTCQADGEQILLTENMMLHIPLGSKHSVSVAEGDILAYLWLDFFFTIDGQKYMEEHHSLTED